MYGENKYESTVTNLDEARDQRKNGESKYKLHLGTKPQNNNSVHDRISSLEAFMHQFTDAFSEVSVNRVSNGDDGGGGNMSTLEKWVENLEKRTESIEKNVIQLTNKASSLEATIKTVSTKEDISKIENSILRLESNINKHISDQIKTLPSEDKVKNIIRDTNKTDEIATKGFVKEELSNMKVWIITTFVAVVLGIIIRLL